MNPNFAVYIVLKNGHLHSSLILAASPLGSCVELALDNFLSERPR